jgi:hypothetical protein
MNRINGMNNGLTEPLVNLISDSGDEKMTGEMSVGEIIVI